MRNTSTDQNLNQILPFNLYNHSYNLNQQQQLKCLIQPKTIINKQQKLKQKLPFKLMNHQIIKYSQNYSNYEQLVHCLRFQQNKKDLQLNGIYLNLQKYTESRLNISLPFNNRKYSQQQTLDTLLESLKIQIQSEGQDRFQCYLIKFHIGLKLFQLGRYTESMIYYVQSQKVFYCNHKQRKHLYSKVLRNIGCVYLFQSNFQQAKDFFQRSKDIQEDILNKQKNKLSLAITLQCFANLYILLGNFKQALQMFDEAKQIIQNNLGIKHTEYAYLQENIAICQQGLGNYKKSIQLFQKTMPILQKTENLQFAFFLGNFGNVCLSQGKIQKALFLFKKSSQIMQKTIKKSHIQYTKVILSFANYKIYIEQFAEAEKLIIQYFDILKSSKELRGYYNIQNAITYANLAQIYKSKQLYQKAISYNEHCLQIKFKVFGINHYQYALTLASLGSVYDCYEDFDQALRYLSKSEQILKKLLGSKHLNYGKVLGSIGNVYKKLNKFQLALKYYEQYLNILQLSKEVQNIEYATTLINISNIYQELQLFMDALKLNKKSMHILKNIFGEINHSLKIKNQQNIKRIHQRNNLFLFKFFQNFQQYPSQNQNIQSKKLNEDLVMNFKVNQLFQYIQQYQESTSGLKLDQIQCQEMAELFQKIINLREQIPQLIIQSKLDEQISQKNQWKCNDRYRRSYFNLKNVKDKSKTTLQQVDLKYQYFKFATERHQNILKELQKNNIYQIFARYKQIKMSIINVQKNQNLKQQAQKLYKLEFQTEKCLRFPQFELSCFQKSQLKPYNVFFNRLNLKTQLKFIKQVSQSLSSLHQLKIQHNDVKIQNVVYSFIDNRFKLIDFSLSKFRKQGEPKSFLNDIQNIEYYQYIDLKMLNKMNEMSQKNKSQQSEHLKNRICQSNQQDELNQFLFVNSFIQSYFKIYDQNQIKMIVLDQISFQKHMNQSIGKLDSLMLGFMILILLYKMPSSLKIKSVMEQYISTKIIQLINLSKQKAKYQSKIKTFFRNKFHAIILPFYKDIIKLFKQNSIQRLKSSQFLINHFGINYQQQNYKVSEEQNYYQSQPKNNQSIISDISDYQQDDFGLGQVKLSIYEKHKQILRSAQELREMIQQNQRTKSLLSKSKSNSQNQNSFQYSWNSDSKSQKILNQLQQVD